MPKSSSKTKKTISMMLCAMTISLPACSETPEEKCEQRIESKVSVTREQSKEFCTCFIEKSSAKYNREEISTEMESSGSHQAFKSALKDEFESCKTRMLKRGD